MMGTTWIAHWILGLTTAALLGADQGDEQYNFIAGLFDRGHHEMVVQEGTKFLRDYPRHERTSLVRYRLGQSFYELGRFAECRDALAPLERDTTFSYAKEARFRLGQSQLELGDNGEAARLFLALSSEEPPHYLSSPAAYFAGEALFRSEKFPEAARSYARALDLEPDDSMKRASLYGLGWSLYRSSQFETAATAFTAYLQRFADQDTDGEVRFLLGECCMQTGAHQDAAQHFTKVPKGDYFDDALSGAGFAHEALGDAARAAQFFLRLESEVPDSPLVAEARLHAGIACFEADRLPAAREVLDRLIGQGESEWQAEAYYWRGQVAAKTQGPEAALQHYESGLRASPADELRQRLILARSDALFDAGRFDEAQAGYREMGGASTDARYSAAVAALNARQYDQALLTANELLAAAPDGPHRLGTLLVAAESLFALERYAEAGKTFEQALAATQPKDKDHAEERARTLSRLGWCAFYQQDFAESEKVFRQLANEFPTDARSEEASFLEGRSALRQGAAERAEKSLRRHLSAFPKGEFEADVRYDLAQALQELGREAEAAKMLESVTSSGAKSSLGLRAVFERAELAEQNGDHAAAEAALRGLLQANPPVDLLRAALYAHAWAAFQLQKYDDADRSLRRLLGKEVGAADGTDAALELMTSVARSRKDAASAIAAYRLLLQHSPDSDRTAEVALVAALAAKETGDAKTAREVLGDALTRWPKFSGRDRLLYERAFLLQEAGDTAAFLADLAEIETQHATSPLAPEAAFFRAEELFQAGDFAAAATAYRGALAADSKVRDLALYKTAWCQFRAEEWVRAAQTFASVPRNHPDSVVAAESLFLAGESLVRAGKFAEATPLLRDFVENHPRHESYQKGLFRLGQCLGEQGQWDGCLKALTELEQKAPDFEQRLESALWMGRSLAALGRPAEAERRFQKVVDEDRGVLSARAHLGLGSLLLARDQASDALGEFLKVALLYQDAQEVGEALFQAGATLEKLGDPARAKAQYQELLQRFPEHSRAAEAKTRVAGGTPRNSP